MDDGSRNFSIYLLPAMYSIVDASGRCRSGPYLTQSVRVRNSTIPCLDPNTAQELDGGESCKTPILRIIDRMRVMSGRVCERP